MSDSTNIPSSCIDGEPFVKLEDGGTAPILNYQVPQKTSFTAYGNIPMNLEESIFSQEAFEIPTAVIQQAENQTIDEIKQGLIDEIDNKGSGNTGYIIGDNVGIFEVQKAEDALSEINATPTTETTSTETTNVENTDSDAIFKAQVFSQDLIAGLNPERMASYVKDGHAMVLRRNFGDFEAKIDYIKRPFRLNQSQKEYIAEPRLFLIEEYVTTSFLGDYGAGQTLKTHSLFPGEKTTITVKTFQELKSTKSRAKNIIDSFSKESAAEMENLVENESDINTTGETNKTKGGGFSLKIKKVFSIGGKGKKTSKSTRETNTRNLSKALSKHVDKSNASREMNVNTTSEDSLTQTDEYATVREFSNPNQSRVLNFTFRELLQEYISITYLNDLKIGFSNGHPEMDRVYSLEELDDLLEDMIQEGKRQEVKDRILFEYQKVESGLREGVSLDFITTKTVETFEGEPYTYLTKRKDVRDTYEIYTGNTVEIPGVILNVDKNTLRTPALVVDALLGKGEALDCFNMYLQDEGVQETQEKNRALANENTKQELILETLNAITDPVQRAEAMAKIFYPPASNHSGGTGV